MTSLEEAWALHDDEENNFIFCHSEIDHGFDSVLTRFALTEIEQEIVDEYEWNDDSADTLQNFYAHCASINMISSMQPGGPDWTSSRVQDDFALVEGLCPDHPQRERVQALVQEAQGA